MVEYNRNKTNRKPRPIMQYISVTLCYS